MLVLFILLASSAFIRSKAKLNQAEDTILSAASVDWSTRDGAIGHLSNMRNLDLQIDELEKWSSITLIKLDRSKGLLDPASALYYEKARDFVRSVPYQTASNRLKRALRIQQLNAQQKEQLYDDVKTVLLLTTEVARLSDENNYRYLESSLKQIAVGELQTQLASSGDAMLKGQIDEQIRVFIDELVAKPETALPELSQRDIRQAQVKISRPSTVRSVYERILRQAALENLPPKSLDELVGSTYSHLFTGNPVVPGVFTQVGWSQFVEEAIERESEDPERDNWVTGVRSTGSQFAGAAPDEVKRDIENLYFEGYERAWRSFLEQIRYAPAGDIRSSYSKIDYLSNSFSSPLLLILENATNQTTFLTDQQMLGNLADNLPESVTNSAGRAGQAGAAAASGALSQQVHPLTQRFRWLHELKAPDEFTGRTANSCI